MSKVINACHERDLAHIVRTKDGKYYYVDSADTFDAGYETMVFPADEKGEVTDWGDLYCERYSSYADMKERHNYIIEHLEEVLK